MVSPPPPPLHSPPPPYMILGWFNLQLARLTSSPHTKSILKTWLPSSLVHIRLLHPSPRCPPSHTLPPSPMQTDEKMRALDLKHSPSLVLLFNWSFISDNQFISLLAAGCIDLLSQAKVKCTLLLPQRRQLQAGVPARDILCYLFFLLRVFLVSTNLPLAVTHCIIDFRGFFQVYHTFPPEC